MKTTYIRKETAERIDLYIAEDDPRTFVIVGFVTRQGGWEHADTIPTRCASAASAKAEMSRFARELIADGYVKQN